MSVENLENFNELGLDDEEEIDGEIDSSEENKSDKEREVELNTLHNENNAAVLKLPREILSYIFRWAVSSSLDVVTLGNCAPVCKEFYALSQESPLWHTMCQRIWGESISRKPYPSWQILYLSKPHTHFHGVYISRTSYLRLGDRYSFTKSKPYYTVEYFRILRFFPNGEILMLTTPKQPREVVHKLESKSKKVQGLLAGKYIICEEDNNTATLTAELEMFYTPKDTTRLSGTRNRRANNRSEPRVSNEYKLELKLMSTSSRKKFNKLVWIKHSCCTRYVELGSENTCTFDTTKQYPPLFFNHIKSFTAESHKPL